MSPQATESNESTANHREVPMKARPLFLLSLLVLGLLTPRPALANKWFGWLEDLSGPGPFRGNTLRFDLVCVGRLNDEEVQQAILLRAKLTGSGSEAQKRTDSQSQETNESASESVEEEAKQLAQQALDRLDWCRADRANVRFSFGVEAGWWDLKEPDARYEGDVGLNTYSLVLYMPLRSVLTRRTPPVDTTRARAFEVGAGLGVYRMSGPAVVDNDYWRFTVPIRLRLFPSELFPTKEERGQISKWHKVFSAFEAYAGYDYIPGVLPSRAFRLTDQAPPTGLSNREFVFVRGFTVNVFAWWPGRAALP